MRRLLRRSSLIGSMVTAGLLALLSSGVRGDIIIDEILEEEIGDPTYIYTAPSAILTAGSGLLAGDFLTIYDIPGLDPLNFPIISVTNPLSWSASVQPIGQTPANTPLPDPDSPSLFNATWIYSGAPINTTVDLNLGLFAIRFFSPLEGLRPPGLQLVYAAQTQVGGGPRGNAGVATVTFVPEPSSIAMLGLALPAALIALRRRRAG